MNRKLEETLSELVCAILAATKERKEEFDWLRSHFEFATKQDLKEMEKRIMSKISEFATKQNEFNDRIDTAVAGLQSDIDLLNEEIKKLQESPGEITPEDQASLDALEQRGAAIAAKIEALDALTPPAPPTP